MSETHRWQDSHPRVFQAAEQAAKQRVEHCLKAYGEDEISPETREALVFDMSRVAAECACVVVYSIERVQNGLPEVSRKERRALKSHFKAKRRSRPK